MTPAGPRMSAELRREAVLEAGMAEFALGGLHGTSTDRVARRAGISQPYLFRLFPTKRDLFVALVGRCFAEVGGMFERVSAGLTGHEALQAMGDAYADLLADGRLLLVQLQTYAAATDPEVRAAARNGYRDLWLLVERISGLPYDEVARFFAFGMLMNVAAALDLPAVDERWARACATATVVFPDPASSDADDARDSA